MVLTPLCEKVDVSLNEATVATTLNRSMHDSSKAKVNDGPSPNTWITSESTICGCNQTYDTSFPKGASRCKTDCERVARCSTKQRLLRIVQMISTIQYSCISMMHHLYRRHDGIKPEDQATSKVVNNWAVRVKWCADTVANHLCMVNNKEKSVFISA